MSDAGSGRTHAVGLVAAAAVALVLLFFRAPLQYVPMAALGAVLIAAAMSLIDLESLRLFYRIDRTEALLSVLATLGVVAVGAVDAILFAVVLALLRFIRLISRPPSKSWARSRAFPGSTRSPGTRRVKVCQAFSCFASMLRSSSSTPPISNGSCCERLMMPGLAYAMSSSTYSR